MCLWVHFHLDGECVFDGQPKDMQDVVARTPITKRIVARADGKQDIDIGHVYRSDLLDAARGP